MMRMSIVEKYWERIYRTMILYVPLACMCAGVYYTICWLNGMFPDISGIWIIIFDVSHWIYLSVSIGYICRRRKRRERIRQLLPKMKRHICLILAIQFNFIIHLFASEYVWVCIFIFFVLIIFLLDFKRMVVNSVFYISSLILGHMLHSQEYLPLDTPYYRVVLMFRVIVVCVVAVFLWSITYLLEQFLEHMEMEEEENRILTEGKLKYYQKLDIMDKELRRFRHDIKNHFVCMENLLSQGDLTETRAYFKALKVELDGTETTYLSGNVVIDSIMNYTLSDLAEDIDVLVFGHLPRLHEVTSMELCTVFSNMLSNAVGALKNQEGHEKKLILHFQEGARYFSITVSNSTQHKDVWEPHTPGRKKDRNHGYGIYQIRTVVEKYQGIFEQRIEDGLFISYVCLPIGGMERDDSDRNL